MNKREIERIDRESAAAIHAYRCRDDPSAGWVLALAQAKEAMRAVGLHKTVNALEQVEWEVRRRTPTVPPAGATAGGIARDD